MSTPLKKRVNADPALHLTQDGTFLVVAELEPMGPDDLPVRLKAPLGDDLAIVSVKRLAFLETQAEDQIDALLAQDALDALEAGEDELLPHAMVKRLSDGENPVRVWREHRGLKVKELAEQVGIAAPYLSQIETGKRDGTISVYKALANALAVDIDDLVV